MDIVVTILIAVAVIAIAAMLLLGWTVVAVVRLILRAVFGRSRIDGPPPGTRITTPMARCPRTNCRHLNPREAQFCRRCGMNLVAATIARPMLPRRHFPARVCS